MYANQWFDDLHVIGRMPPQAAARKLAELGDFEAAAIIEAGRPATDKATFSLWGKLFEKAYRNTSHAFGFIPPADADIVPIHNATRIKPDVSLRGVPIKITLDQLYAVDYPGSGQHSVLFDFYAKHQVAKDQSEHLHFNAIYRVQEGQRAGVSGQPIFVGLQVGDEGVDLKCFTVNVKNSNDESFLSFLDSDVFRAGLKLVTAAQPAIGPLSTMALSITRSIASRNRNVPVQDFYLGLDFSNVTTRAKLAVGSYVAVQIPETREEQWGWDRWKFRTTDGRIVSTDGSSIPYNYILFSVSRYGA